MKDMYVHVHVCVLTDIHRLEAMRSGALSESMREGHLTQQSAKPAKRVWEVNGQSCSDKRPEHETLHTAQENLVCINTYLYTLC